MFKEFSLGWEGGSLSARVTRFQSLPFVVPLVVTRCTTRCHSLSLHVPLVCLFLSDLFLAMNLIREKMFGSWHITFAYTQYFEHVLPAEDQLL